MKSIKLFSFIFMIILASCSDTKMPVIVEKVLPIKAKLGEGAIWDYKNNRLLWVDIEGHMLYVYEPEQNINKGIDVGQRIGTVVPYTTDEVIVALEDGIYTLSLATGDKVKVADPEAHISTNRFNDGKCDPAGRFWIGSMVMKGPRDNAALYMIDFDFGIHKMEGGITTSNGIVWSSDKTKMYYIDTPTRKVVEYLYDNENGDITYSRDAIVIPDSLGHPDGSTIDAEGKIWIGMWGGGSVTRWDPESGELLDRISIPAKNVTSCAFGGKDLDILYITTASIGMKEEEKEVYPDAGGLFYCKPVVKGIKANYFRMGED